MVAKAGEKVINKAPRLAVSLNVKLEAGKDEFMSRNSSDLEIGKV